MASSWVDVINDALTMLGATSITSLTDNTKQARIANDRFGPCRDSVLRMRFWKTATARVELPKLAQAPIFGYGSMFQLPSDYIRLFKMHPQVLTHKIEGDKILANAETLKMIYIYRPDAPNLLDPLLLDTIAHYLAYKMSYALLQSYQVQANMYKAWKEIYREAKSVDSMENTTETWEAMELKTSRLAGTAYDGTMGAFNIGEF